MKKISFVAAISLLAFSACKESYKKGDNGLEYKIVAKGSGEVIPYGQFMQIHVAQFYNNGKTEVMKNLQAGRYHLKQGKMPSVNYISSLK